MAKNRIIWVDWAKSVCMFLVVLGHCHIQSSMYMITQVIYSFHIPLFFFISGLLCPKHFSKSTLLKDIREAIKNDRLLDFKNEFFKKFGYKK